MVKPVDQSDRFLSSYPTLYLPTSSNLVNWKLILNMGGMFSTDRDDVAMAPGNEQNLATFG